MMKGLGDGTITPGYEKHNGWFVDDCECGAVDPKECSCPCGFTMFRDALFGQLDRCTHLDPDHVAAARRDWQTHFADWGGGNHTAWLRSKRPTWGFPHGTTGDGSDDEVTAGLKATGPSLCVHCVTSACMKSHTRAT